LSQVKNVSRQPAVGTFSLRIGSRVLQMRIAQIAPLHERVPLRLYGGTERVVSMRGWLIE
jgi:hypothetical protein